MARNPEAVSIFNAAMVDLTRFVTPDILRAYDFGRITHLMDVGGAPANSSVPLPSNTHTFGRLFSIFPGALNWRSTIWIAWASVVAPNSCLVIFSKRSPPAQMPSS